MFYRDALVFAFGDLIFTTTRPRRRITRLVLNSGNEIEVENTRTGISRVRFSHKLIFMNTFALNAVQAHL